MVKPEHVQTPGSHKDVPGALRGAGEAMSAKFLKRYYKRDVPLREAVGCWQGVRDTRFRRLGGVLIVSGLILSVN